MGAFTYIETDTGTNVDIHAATAVGAYTSTGDKLIMVDVSIDAVAGNGDYVMYVTRQIGGSGSAYRILPQTTMTAASGLTAISGQSGWITVRNGDVLTCYVVGLAGDTTTPDWSTRWFELAGVTAAAVADAVWDEATADHTTASSFGSLDANVDAILADTGTDGVVLASTQGAITWAQQKIVANVDGEGALDVYNSSALGIGQYNHAPIYGMQNEGGDGLYNVGSTGNGQKNEGSVNGLMNTGGLKNVFGHDPALALESTLTAIKGAGWSTETLAAIDVLIDAIKVKTDALNNSAVTFVTAVNGTTITILRGDTFSGSITDIGALTDYVSLDFTVKEIYSKTDDEATIRIRKNASGVGDGLMRLSGAAPTSSALGSIAIDDLASGDITITLDETAADDLSTGTYVYDIQMITASNVTTLTYGKLIVSADVTRLVA